MLKKILLLSSFVLLGSLTASAQDQSFEDKWKSEPTVIEKTQQDFDIARDLQRENDRREQEIRDTPSIADTVREIIERSINESADRNKDKKP